jgi:predicted transcriptional regulator
MIRRIVSSDDDERMPPPHFASKLTEDEVAKLKKWIDQGAKYTKHWSFDALEVPTVVPVDPPEAFQAWRNSPIDQLVLRQLTKKGWLPSRQADKSVLLRRLSIDLTGLPPSLQEQHDFLKEDSPLSYERTVDRLLSSPAFGEHWARKWLDMARYADSAGYADDPPRTIWGYLISSHWSN